MPTEELYDEGYTSDEMKELTAEELKTLQTYQFLQQRDISVAITLNATNVSERNITYAVSDESSPTRALTIVDLPEVSLDPNSVEFVYNRFEKSERVSRNNPSLAQQDEKILSTNDAIAKFNLKSRYIAPPRYIKMNYSGNVSDEFSADLVDINKFALTSGGTIDRPSFKGKISDIINDINPDQILVEGGLYSYYYSGTELIDTGLDKKYLKFVENFSKIDNDIRNVDPRKRSRTKKVREMIEELKENDQLSDKDLFSEVLKLLSQKNVNKLSDKEELMNQIRALSHSLAFSNLCFDKIIKASLDSRTSLYEDELRSYKGITKDVYDSVITSIQAETMQGSDFETQIGSTYLYDYEVLDDLVQARNGEDEEGIIAGVVHIGYLIERVEVIRDQVTFLDPVIKGLNFTEFIDVDVAYGGTYIYKVRNLFLVEYDCISDSGQFLRASFVIASQGKTVIKSCFENQSPKPPQSVKFKYDHKNKGLLISWEFPPNPQGDIKYFQVFRRNSINEPFQLIKYYDFDDTIGKVRQREYPSRKEYIRLSKNGETYALTNCIDYEFNKKSEAIYAVGCADAHGLISNLSAQFRVKYNNKNRKVDTQLVVTSGTPRPYPNLFLNVDTVQDAMKISGKNRMTVYFTPDVYKTFKGSQAPKKFISTTETDNPTYKFNFVNTDLQKSKMLNITIKDVSTSNDSLGAPYLEPNNLSFSLTKNE